MIHLLIVVCMISCICDFLGVVLAHLTDILKELEGNRSQSSCPAMGVEGEIPNTLDMINNFSLSKINVFTILRLFVGLLSLGVKLLMPYYLLGMFNKAAHVSYHRQLHSYIPFMILDFEKPELLKDELAGTEFAAPESDQMKAVNGLTSFNRYIAFMVAKTAMKAIYSTFHAIYSPAGYLEQILNRDKAAAK